MSITQTMVNLLLLKQLQTHRYNPPQRWSEGLNGDIEPNADGSRNCRARVCGMRRFAE